MSWQRFSDVFQAIASHPEFLQLLPGGAAIVPIVGIVSNAVRSAEGMVGASGPAKKEHALELVKAGVEVTDIAHLHLDKNTTVLAASQVIDAVGQVKQAIESAHKDAEAKPLPPAPGSTATPIPPSSQPVSPSSTEVGKVTDHTADQMTEAQKAEQRAADEARQRAEQQRTGAASGQAGAAVRESTQSGQPGSPSARSGVERTGEGVNTGVGNPNPTPAGSPRSTGSAVPLRNDGPTIEEYTSKGYSPTTYPPEGFAEVSSPGLDRFKATGQVVEQSGPGNNPPANPAIPPGAPVPPKK